MNTNRRIALTISMLSVASFGCMCCCGFDPFATSKKIQEADSLWDKGDRANAVAEYKALFGKSMFTQKEKMLPRIVEQELKAGNRDEAKTWIKRGLDEKLKVEYADPASKELFAVLKKDHDDRLAQAAEEDRKKKGVIAEEKRKKQEEERGGELELLDDTLQGKINQFGGEITGTVVNNRKTKLRYVQITFNLYDEGGARVGTALANINDLEPGGRWNFKAIATARYKTYKLSELKGF